MGVQNFVAKKSWSRLPWIARPTACSLPVAE